MTQDQAVQTVMADVSAFVASAVEPFVVQEIAKVYADLPTTAPATGVSSDQEKADIAAAVASAVQPLNDQITALNLAKSTEDKLLASVQSSIANLQALFIPQAPEASAAPAQQAQPST